MKKLSLIVFAVVFTAQTYAQTTPLKQNTDWLANQLNKLVIDDDDKGLNVNGKKSKPVFSFAGSKMLMSVNAKDEGFSMGFNISWLLKDVRKVSYKEEKSGNYELVLDVPADRIKMDLGFGKDNSIGGSFNVKDEEKDSHTSFTLSTKDEALVKDIVQHFDKAIAESRR
jgi:hypothetical protein